MLYACFADVVAFSIASAVLEGISIHVGFGAVESCKSCMVELQPKHKTGRVLITTPAGAELGLEWSSPLTAGMDIGAKNTAWVLRGRQYIADELLPFGERIFVMFLCRISVRIA